MSSCPTVFVETRIAAFVHVENDCGDTLIHVIEGALPGSGGGSGVARYIHNQASPLSQWTVNHNLGVYPAAVNVKSVGGIEVGAQVTHVSVNQLLVNFSAPFAGSAVIL